jgi:serine/threonine protein kinase
MKHHPDYELFEELGRGQSTIVYRGHDLTLGRDVAIKELNDEKIDLNPNRTSQFLKEAQFLAQFEHENILRVYSVEKQHNWIVMEMMKATLASQILNDGLDPDLVRSVLRQTLRALDFLHRKQKVHAAIRPSNLLINEEGFVKISDFEETGSKDELRIPDCGKKYLAPELLRPDFGEFGPALDFYNLGFAALELLFGPRFDSLFPGTGEGAINADIAWMRWHSSDEQLSPTGELGLDVPADIANVIDRLLVKQVDSRPKSAEEILALLDDRPLIRVDVETAQQPPSTRNAYVGAVREVGEQAAHVDQPNEIPSKKQPKKKRTKDAQKKLNGKALIGFVKRPSVLVSLFTVLVVVVFFASANPSRKSNAARSGNESAPTPATEIQVATEQITEVPTTELVTLMVSPASAAVTVGGQIYEFEDGFLEVELEKNRELELNISHEGYSSAELLFTWQELVESGFMVSIDLELNFQGPQLPSGLTAIDGSALDAETQLPLRAVSNVLSKGLTIEFLLVTPGASSRDEFQWEMPADELLLEDPFYIAVTETSIAQYSKFYQRMGAPSAGEGWVTPSQAWIGNFDKDQTDSDLPVTNMSQAQAQEFCRWLGGRLPTENEWETAVRYLSSGKIENDAQANRRLFRGSTLRPQSVGIGAQTNENLLNAIGNAAEWCVTDNTDQPIAKGCSFATPTGSHVQPTWRSTANPAGEWDIGVRAVIPVEVTDD